MPLTAIFEEWYLGDGIYPQLRRGQFVKLAFELEPQRVEFSSGAAQPYFERLADAEYRFRGTVLVAEGFPPRRLPPIVEVTTRRFALANPWELHIPAGALLEGDGTLKLDTDGWALALRDGRHGDPLDLFLALRLERIRRVTVPERFVSRNSNGVGGPTYVSAHEYAAGDVDDIEQMDVEQDTQTYLPPERRRRFSISWTLLTLTIHLAPSPSRLFRRQVHWVAVSALRATVLGATADRGFASRIGAMLVSRKSRLHAPCHHAGILVSLA